MWIDVKAAPGGKSDGKSEGQPNRQTNTLHDSGRAYAYTGGKPFDPKQPVIVFVHGAQLDHSVWILQSRYLAHHGFSVLAVDLPGHGRTDTTTMAKVEDLSAWLLRLLDAAGVDRATLVGHSLGSLIALEVCGMAPARVEKLVLVGSAFPMRVSDSLLTAARESEAAAFDMINTWSHTGVTHSPGSPGPGFSVFIQNRRLMERQRPGVLSAAFEASNRYAGGFDRAQGVNCPTLLILGRNDQMTPIKAGRALAARIKGSRVVEIERCGHSLMAERPDAVLTALKDFLAA